MDPNDLRINALFTAREILQVHPADVPSVGDLIDLAAYIVTGES